MTPALMRLYEPRAVGTEDDARNRTIRFPAPLIPDGIARASDLKNQHFRWVISPETQHGHIDLCFDTDQLLALARKWNGKDVMVTGTRPLSISNSIAIGGHDERGNHVRVAPLDFLDMTTLEPWSRRRFTNAVTADDKAGR
jgi:hypothetical protein